MKTKRVATLALALAASSAAASVERLGPIEGPIIPVLDAEPTRDQAGDVALVVTTTDARGRGPGQSGYSGASASGQCRVYFNKTTPVTSMELRDTAFKQLDSFVKRAGGVEPFLRNPERVPRVYIWADAQAPWRCVAGAIYNMQISGYPTIGFVSVPVRSGTAATNATHIDLPPPMPPDQPRSRRDRNRITVTITGGLLWNENPLSAAEFERILRMTMAMRPEPDLEFAPEPQVPYATALKVLGMIKVGRVTRLSFAGILDHSEFGKGGRSGRQ